MCERLIRQNEAIFEDSKTMQASCKDHKPLQKSLKVEKCAEIPKVERFAKIPISLWFLTRELKTVFMASKYPVDLVQALQTNAWLTG